MVNAKVVRLVLFPCTPVCPSSRNAPIVPLALIRMPGRRFVQHVQLVLSPTNRKPQHLAQIVQLGGTFWTTLPLHRFTTIKAIVCFVPLVHNSLRPLHIVRFALQESFKIKTTTTPPFVSIAHLDNIY